MKKIFAVMAVALSAITMMAQQPVITFDKTEHDFGKINEADGRVSTIFEFKNNGMEPLVLSNVRASCGCTTPNWTREPVEPGQTGKITVTYNPNGRPGRFQKTITITSNASEPTTKVFIKGEVIPKPAAPAPNSYPVQMGDLSLKAKSVNFGTVKKGQSIFHDIEYANRTDHDITVELATRAEDNFLISQVTLPTVKPNQTGKIALSFDGAACKLYGPVEASAIVVVNGKQINSDEYKLTCKAEVIEDFSELTEADRQQAPILVADQVIDFGDLVAGKKIKKALAIQNAGVNPLFIRRVYNPNYEMFKVTAPASLKSGKKGELKVELNTIQNGQPLAAGKYSRQITLYTNDPQRSKVYVTIKWNVQ